MAPLTSPPSLGPSLHPPKRCRMDGLSRSKPLSLAPPSSFLSPPAPPGGVVSLPASPCSESVTMQRSMVMQQATTISGDQLAKRLRAREGRPGRQSFLLLDCRPFIAYNVGHVRGAINVNCCDRFNRKRLQQVKIPKLELILVGQYTQALWPTHICIQFKWRENFQKANSARLLYFTMIYLNMNDRGSIPGQS